MPARARARKESVCSFLDSSLSEHCDRITTSIRRAFILSPCHRRPPWPPDHKLVPHVSLCSYFIYPDDDSVEGSTAVFTALHAAMLEKRQLAVVRFSRSANATPHLAALVAQREKRSEDGAVSAFFPDLNCMNRRRRRVRATAAQDCPHCLQVQLASPGMHVVILPFADDIRDLVPHPPLPETGVNMDDAEADADATDPQEEQLGAARTLMRALALPSPADCHFKRSYTT